MTEKTIKDITIQLDEHGKISSVTINGKNIRDDIIFPQLQRLSHNSKSQQKEAQIGLYNQKGVFHFAKYLIMRQPH